MAPEVTLFENVFSFFSFAAVIGLVVALLPIEAIGQPPSAGETLGFLPWLLLMAVVFLIPVMCMQLYSVKLVDPGRVGILFQAEVVFGIVSAAILLDEPFGWQEATGAALVVGSALIEVLANRPRPAHSQTNRPQTSKPQTSKPQTSKPQTSKPQTSKPQTSKPQTSKPQTSKPQTSKPQTSKKENPE